MSSKDSLYDLRVVDKLIREGAITDADYQKHLNSLPNLENKVDRVSINEIAPQSYLRAIMGSDKEDHSLESSENKDPQKDSS